MFTPELIKSAWKAVGICPYNPDIIPLEKLAPSETSTTLLTTASAIHSTPVHKIISVFLYFDMSLGCCDDDGSSSSSHNNGSNVGNGNDDAADLFLLPFTPWSHMCTLHQSFALDPSTSYLISKEPVSSSLNIIKPIHEKPYLTKEPDWSLIQKPMTGNPNQQSHEKLLEWCQALEIALDRAKKQIPTCDVVIKASHATVVIIELHAQKLWAALHMKEGDKE